MKELKKLQEAKKRLESYIKDEYKDEAAEAIADMLSAQAQSDIEEVELVVPCKSVIKRIDLGPVELVDTTCGILFNAKGVMSTLIKPSYVVADGDPAGAYGRLKYIVNNYEDGFKEIEDDEVREAYKLYTQAWLYILQSPIFCALKDSLTFDIAAAILNGFNEVSKELMETELKEETEEEVKKNVLFNDTMSTLEEE